MVEALLASGTESAPSICIYISTVKPGDSEASTLDNKTGLMCRYELSLWSPALLISLTDLQIIVGIAH